jgi:hypothetical protein
LRNLFNFFNAKLKESNRFKELYTWYLIIIKNYVKMKIEKFLRHRGNL